jgi:DNA-binding beta-propeller fold protein YncE
MKSTQQRAIGHFQVAFLALAVVLLVASAAVAAERKKEIYVVNSKPPSVSIIDAEHWQRMGTISIDENPTHVVMGPGNRFLYVLQNGMFYQGGAAQRRVDFEILGRRKHASNLSVVDLEARGLRTMPLGWNVSTFALTEDGRYLICFALGKPSKKQATDEWGRLTVVNPLTGEATFQASNWRLGEGILWTADASRIFVLGTPEIVNGKGLFASLFDLGGAPPGALHRVSVGGARVSRYVLSIFSDRSEKPLAEIPLDGYPTVMPVSIFLSADQKQLTVSGFGKKFKVEQVVVNVDSAKRIDADEVSGSVERSAVLPAAPNLSRRMALVSQLPGEPIASARLPGQDREAVLTSDHQLGIVNFEENRLEHVVKIGRGSIRGAKLAGKVALAGGAVVFAGSLTGVAFLTAYTSSSWTQALHRLIATPDGRFLYALDTSSNDVTIVNSEDGSVLDYIPVGSDCMGLLLTSDGRFIWAIARTRLTLIDTASNKQRFQHEFAPAAGRLQDWKVLPENGRILLLFDNQLQAWDPEQASSLATIKGLSEARLLVLPREAK